MSFIDLLRKSGLAVSPEEAISAQKIMDLAVFTTKQEQLKTALRSALLKKHDQKELFDTCFDIFFLSDHGKEKILNADTTSRFDSFSELRSHDFLGDLTLSSVLGASGENLEQLLSTNIVEGFTTSLGQGSGTKRQTVPPQLALLAFLRWVPSYLRGIAAQAVLPQGSSTQAVTTLVQLIIEDAHPPASVMRVYYRFENLFSRAVDQAIEWIDSNRILNQENRQSVKEELKNISKSVEEVLRKARLELLRIGKLTPAELLRYVSEAKMASKDIALLDTEFGKLPSNVEAVQGELVRLGQKLALSERRRRRRNSRGVPDFRRTFRDNLGNGGVLINVRFRKRVPRDPTIYLLVDVSMSVNWVSDWFLTIAYAASRVWNLRLFEFVDTTVEITEAMKEKTIKAALEAKERKWKEIIRPSMGHSNYNTSLEDFLDIIGTIKRKATIIVLGDCRDYYGAWDANNNTPMSSGAPRSSLLIRKLASAAKVLILNPESPRLWGTGDSAAYYYKREGAEVHYVRDLRGLVRFVFDRSR